MSSLKQDLLASLILSNFQVDLNSDDPLCPQGLCGMILALVCGWDGTSVLSVALEAAHMSALPLLLPCSVTLASS